ncbi:MAG: 2-oxoglutarate/2-oxoacid ferredoxin oxidoreductase, alpha subunit (EC 1.2.7.-) [Olavius algarvensis Delta 4 endosymbiont]|nr:MAG: 2-oxoglutarate/2-oxoacid ferredoxin oxidoreductase, alpha subunit (EC 1.2.7.-) [Olavius algarvensis Delta 4 endosymbiont]
MNLSFIEGNEAIALGAMASGCRFFAGYPITPATTILNNMLKYLPPADGVCLQGEDEIASIGYCLGASMAGMKVMTATSGPGISLYSEQISFAIGSEIPLVIVNIQRLGPSTGSATLGADGDVQFMRWGNSGGLPVIVLAPSDPRECYELTRHAFNLAETYRCPVFIASNKEIAMTKESVDLDALSDPGIVDRQPSPAGTDYLPFATPDGIQIPYFEPIGGDILSRQTSSTHGPNGYITVDPGQIEANVERLRDKLSRAVNGFSYYEYDPVADTDTLLITYGVTTRAAMTAVRNLEASGKPVSHLSLKTLWPVPEEKINEIAEKYDRIVMVEMNLGQYVREIERILPEKRVSFLGQMNGKLITPAQIERTVNYG